MIRLSVIFVSPKGGIVFGHFEFTTAPNLMTALSEGREPTLS